jgi:hypothetical protein
MNNFITIYSEACDSMRPSITSEEMITQYLLGELSQEECLKIEETFFEDNTFFQQMLIIEAELTDDYVNGTLQGESKERFKTRLLKNSERNGDLALSRLLIDTAANASKNSTNDYEPNTLKYRLKNFFSTFLGNTLAPKIAWATLAFMLLIAPWVIWKNSREEANREVAAVNKEDKIENNNITPASLVPENIPNENQAKPAVNKAKPTKKPNIASIALIARSLRSEGETNLLKIPSRVSVIRFQLKTEESIYKHYKVIIQSPEGQEHYKRSGIKPTKNNNITITIPSKTLSTGDYIVVLSGSTKEEEFQDIAKYWLQIEKE